MLPLSASEVSHHKERSSECDIFHYACVMHNVAFRLNDRLSHLIPISFRIHFNTTQGENNF